MMLDKTEAVDQLKSELATALHRKAVLEAADDFYVFVKLLANLMLDGNTYRDGRHIQAIAATLEDVEAGDVDRLMIMLPPGSMKSVLLMMFTAWSLGRHPTWRVIWVSHTSDKAQDCSRRVRDLIESAEYKEIFPHIQMRDDVRGVTEWKLVQGGSFLPKGAGASIAGYRFNLGILDDPLSEQTAKSEAGRKAVLDWYYPGFRSRKLPDSRIILVNTRWHVNDLSGYLLEKATKNGRVDQWEVISIPAILDDKASQYLMLPAGQSYWPEYITLDDLKSTEAGSTKEDWAALYLQSPTAESGNLYNKDDFQDWDEDEPPECVEVIMTMDTAFKAKAKSDFSVIQTWGIFYIPMTDDRGESYDEPNAILLNMVKDKFTYPQLRSVALEQYRRFKPDKIIIEDAASGQSLLQDLKLNNLPVLPFRPDRDKVARAHAVSGLVERGRVWLPSKKKYTAELLKEVLEFPKGAHDDAVDAMNIGLLYFRRRYDLTQEEVRRPNTEPRARRPSYWRKVVNGRY